MSEFEVGDKVIWTRYESYGTAEVLGSSSGGRVDLRFSGFDGYDDTDESVRDRNYNPYGVDFHSIPKGEVRKRTLAEKRADDAKVIGESADKVQATLESGGRDYYGGDTVLKFIEDMGLGFSLGNSVKYISRAGKKDAATKRADLVKARDYLTREIDKLEETE